MMDKRAAKIRKMTEEVSKMTAERFVNPPVQKKPAQIRKMMDDMPRSMVERFSSIPVKKKPVQAQKTMDEVPKTVVNRFVTLPIQKKSNAHPSYRRGKTRRMDEQMTPVITDVNGVPGTENVVTEQTPANVQSQSVESSINEFNELSDDVTERSIPANATRSVGDSDDLDADETSSEFMHLFPAGTPKTFDEEELEQEQEPPGLLSRFKDRVKQEAHDRYTKAGGATGIARSAIDVAKDGLHSKDVDINSMTSDQKDEIARTLGGYSGRTDAEITTSLRQIDNTIAQYNTALSKKKEEFSQAEITVREKDNAAYKAKLERDRAQREYSNLLSSWSRMKPGPEKDQLESTITTKANDLLKAETEYNEKDEERVREERNKARIQNELDDIGRKITNTVEKKKELVNDKNLLLTALYRGLANKKKEEVGLYKKFKREMSERGKTMAGMGNMLSAKGVEWNDKLLAKPGMGAADGVSRIVGRNVGYHPSRSVTDVVVGSANNNRNRALVDSLTTINAGRSVTPLGAPGSVHDGIGRQIQPTVRAGQVQMPQLSAPRLAGRPGQGTGRLTVNMPDVRSFGTTPQSTPQPAQQPVTAEMPKLGEFGKESITTFRKANNQMRFVFGDRKSNKGKRKHK